MSGNWVLAAQLDDFDDDRVAFKTEGFHIGLFRVDGAIYALDNICTHGNAMLTDGEFDGCLIECPLHAGLVDLRDGRACGTPITRDTRRYEVRVDGDAVYVELPA